MLVSEISEFELINRIQEIVSPQNESSRQPIKNLGHDLILSIGDDAAVFDSSITTNIMTADALVENIHFSLEWTSFRDLGWKSIVASQSDVASMGCIPTFAIITLGLRPDLPVDGIIQLYEGMSLACQETGGTIIGGDIVASETFFISVTIKGTLAKDKKETQILLRKKESLIKNTEVILVMSHLACADNPKNLKNEKQLNQFKTISRHFPNVKLSLSNSAGILLGKKYHFDLVRPGISLYGGNCTLRKRNIYNHVISLKAKIIQTRNINKGETIGYGATYKAKRKMLIATSPVGYADGINRLFSNRIDLYCRNKKVKIIGRVSMDLMTVDLTKFIKSRLTENDYVELVNLKNNIDYLSKAIKTIPYEILTSLGKRYQRRYIS